MLHLSLQLHYQECCSLFDLCFLWLLIFLLTCSILRDLDVSMFSCMFKIASMIDVLSVGGTATSFLYPILNTHCLVYEYNCKGGCAN